MSERDNELYKLSDIVAEFSDDLQGQIKEKTEIPDEHSADSDLAESTSVIKGDAFDTSPAHGKERLEKTKRSTIRNNNNKIPPKRQWNRYTIILAVILVLALLAFLVIPGLGGNLLSRIANNTVLMLKAKMLKADIKELGEAIIEQNVDEAERSEHKMQQDLADIKSILEKGIWSAAGTLPPVKAQMDDVKSLLGIVEEADREIVVPLLLLMRECPVSELNTDLGVNDAAILDYLRFFEDVIPKAKDYANRIRLLDLSRFDSSGSFQELLDKMDDIIVLLEIAEEADKEIISPLLPILEEYPLSQLKNEEGQDYIAITKYISMFHMAFPEIKELAVRVRAIDLNSFFDENASEKYTEVLDEFIALMNTAEVADKSIIGPSLQVMEEYPFSELKTEDGVNVTLVLEYLDLCEIILPEANKLSEQLKTLELPWFESRFSLSKYIEKLGGFLEFGNDAIQYLPIFKGILGNGSDSRILLVAQCLSEMRSTGGFPGHMGTVEIEDGILSINQFRSVWKVMPDKAPESAGITKEETKLFIGFEHPRDAVFCPDFERVARIWAEGYKERQKAEIDGVVAVTPVIIQRLLSFLGSIELTDGTVMNGENAVRVLGRDIYFNYFTKDSGYTQREADNYTDVLFREAAEKTLDLAMSSISLSSIPDYYSVFVDGMNEKSIQVWVADEKVQQLIREHGWNTHLGNDKNSPQLGIYFNSAGNGGSKDSWFLDINTDISEATINDDGSRSYKVSVSFSNVMTNEEVKAASRYIKGLWNEIIGYVYFFAPSGGSIVDFKSGLSFSRSNYENLNLIATWVAVKNSRPTVIEFTVTTAPGVDAVPIIVTNQTNTEYR